MKIKYLKYFVIIALSVNVLSCSRKSSFPFFQPLHPAHKVLSQGLEVMTLEDHELPTAQIYAYIRGGSVFDPIGKEGLAGIAMQTIRLGGSENRSSDQVEEDLEFTGAALEMGASPESFSASLGVMKKDLDTGLGILFDLLKKPKLDPARFALIKAMAKDGLLREQEDPLFLGSKEYAAFVYGTTSPWGRKATVESIESITLDDVKKFYADFIHPDRMIFATAGDFSVDEFATKIEGLQKDWAKSTSELPAIAPVQEKFEKGSLIIPKKGLTQSTILIGHLGAKRENPDKFALLVMNFMVGGSGALTSRMGEVIRSDAGKAYGVWSEFGFGKDLGLFRAVAQTAVVNTDWVAHKMEEMIQQIAQHPDFSEEEVTRAKQAILRSLIFDFETRFAQVREQAKFHLWGYPDNYLETLQHEIAKVSLKDVNRVAQKYLHADGLKTVIVTEEKEVKRLTSSQR